MLMTAYTYEIIEVAVNWNYCLYIGSATMALYAIHRVIGIDKVGRFSDEGRFAIIKEHSNHLQIYVVLSGIAALYFFWQLEYQIWLWLIIPSIISLLYVLPIFPGYRRLRDYPYVKIFLIAIVWVWLTTIIPVLQDDSWNIGMVLLILVKFLFLIAITIPFDIRDVDVDKNTGVPTLVSLLGTIKSRQLALILMGLYAVGVFLIYQWNHANIEFLYTEYIVMIITVLLIRKSRSNYPDYYYSLYLDGTMGLFWIIMNIINLF